MSDAGKRPLAFDEIAARLAALDLAAPANADRGS